jgi:GTP-binding protein
MQPDGKGRVRLDHPGPGLIGFQSDFLTMTRGTGVMSHVFDDYGPMKPEIAERRNGVLVSAEDGEAVAYALWKLQERGRMFVDPGVDGSPKSAEDLRPWASRTRKCFVTTSRADFCR